MLLHRCACCSDESAAPSRLLDSRPAFLRLVTGPTGRRPGWPRTFLFVSRRTDKREKKWRDIWDSLLDICRQRGRDEAWPMYVST